MSKIHVMVPFSADQFEATYMAVLESILEKERQAEASSEPDTIAYLMSRIATLNVVLEKMDPQASHSPRARRESGTRTGGEEPPSGQNWR